MYPRRHYPSQMRGKVIAVAWGSGLITQSRVGDPAAGVGVEAGAAGVGAGAGADVAAAVAAGGGGGGGVGVAGVAGVDGDGGDGKVIAAVRNVRGMPVSMEKHLWINGDDDQPSLTAVPLPGRSS